MDGIKKKILKWIVAYLCLLLTACGNQSQEVQESEEKVPGRPLTAQTGTIKTSGYDADEYCDSYIIRSEEELRLFLSYMRDFELSGHKVISALNFDEETLLIIPKRESSSSYDYAFHGVELADNELRMEYELAGTDQQATCDETIFYAYAIVPNSELPEEHYCDWVKPSEVLMPGRITTIIWTERTTKYEKDWEDNNYIIQSEKEMQIFLENIDDKELKGSWLTSEHDYEELIVLVRPIQVNTSDSKCHCRVLKLEGNELILDYTLEEGTIPNDGERIYLYVVTYREDLPNDTYEGWVKPSEVFGK
ncbi:MAG: hypothetical protein IJ335_05185 [Lachnospiraceae bacterium]|nr:hypothetical protein [Lachnospiraceae bacterium]